MEVKFNPFTKRIEPESLARAALLRNLKEVVLSHCMLCNYAFKYNIEAGEVFRCRGCHCNGNNIKQNIVPATWQDLVDELYAIDDATRIEIFSQLGII